MTNPVGRYRENSTVRRCGFQCGARIRASGEFQLDAIDLRGAEPGCVEYFRVMQYRGFDDPDTGEDPELAQARIFLDELERHVVKLTRRLQTAPTADARQSINAELSTVRRYVDRIHRRFPGIAVANPFRGAQPGAPAL